MAWTNRRGALGVGMVIATPKVQQRARIQGAVWNSFGRIETKLRIFKGHQPAYLAAQASNVVSGTNVPPMHYHSIDLSVLCYQRIGKKRSRSTRTS